MDQETQTMHQNLNVLAKIATSDNMHSRVALKSKENMLNFNNTENTVKDIKKCYECKCGNCDGSCDKENSLQHSKLETPQKKMECYEPPVTPTANLKILGCAASVLGRKEEEKRKLFQAPESLKTENNTENEYQFNKSKSKRGELMGRKEKSLGLLCKKFMMVYPEYSHNGTTLLLDDVVKTLSIGRRRVYDIVNVLESMEMMVRQAKNKYLWFGKSRLPSTLRKLKALALRVYGPKFSNILNQFQHIQPKVGQGSIGVLLKGRVPDIDVTPLDTDEPLDDVTHSIMDDIISYDLSHRENNRSLGILCQKFIMLFMVGEESVTLDRAAKLLITEPEEGPGKYKTKVRRLYDIANILTSIDFLQKCTSYEDATKKAAYRWIGIDLNSLNSGEDTNRAFQTQEFSLTRHSLLSQMPRKNQASSSGRLKFQCRSVSAHQLTSPGNNLQTAGKFKFPRTFSATATVVKQEETDTTESTDGFDVECWINESQDETCVRKGSDSPTETLFKEKLRELQKEFPDKLPNNGLLDLLSACRKSTATAQRASRRSLSADFASKDSTAPPAKKTRLSDEKTATVKKEMKLFSNKISQAKEDVKPSQAPVVYAALKPLLSYESIPKQISIKPPANKVAISQPMKYQQAAYLTIPATFKQVSTTASQVTSPLLVSPIGSSSSTKNAFYQIIPVPCQQLSNKNLIVFNQPKPVTANHNGIKQLLRPPMTSSASLVISPNNTRKMLSDPVASVSQQLYTEKYHEFVTPPHVVVGSSSKPPANPILFPKLTPETPSSAMSYSLMNAVTRKLMSSDGIMNNKI